MPLVRNKQQLVAQMLMDFVTSKAALVLSTKSLTDIKTFHVSVNEGKNVTKKNEVHNYSIIIIYSLHTLTMLLTHHQMGSVLIFNLFPLNIW